VCRSTAEVSIPLVGNTVYGGLLPYIRNVELVACRRIRRGPIRSVMSFDSRLTVAPQSAIKRTSWSLIHIVCSECFTTLSQFVMLLFTVFTAAFIEIILITMFIAVISTYLIVLRAILWPSWRGHDVHFIRWRHELQLLRCNLARSVALPISIALCYNPRLRRCSNFRRVESSWMSTTMRCRSIESSHWRIQGANPVMPPI